VKIFIPVLCAVALLAGCAKKDPEIEVPKVVVYWHQLEERDDLEYFEEKPFTGVSVGKYPNGQKRFEQTYKDGKKHGLAIWWNGGGQKKEEGTIKDGKPWSATVWKPNGEKCPDTNLKKGNGTRCLYHENGQKMGKITYKYGKSISVKSWDKDGNPRSGWFSGF
jgi:antitoxin component YwqK of YwqJK toxin-antitoxin module